MTVNDGAPEDMIGLGPQNSYIDLGYNVISHDYGLKNWYDTGNGANLTMFII